MTVSFWDRSADQIAEPAGPERAHLREVLRRTRAALPPHARVLELGCGTGGVACALAPDVRHILATDASSPVLGRAQARVAAAGVRNVTVRRLAVEDLRRLPVRFDAVLALNLLHFVPDLPARLRDIRERLGPGGLFVMTAYCLRDGPVPLRGLIGRARLPGLLPRLRPLARADIDRRLRQAGFDIETRWHPSRRSAVLFIARVPPRPATISH